MPGGVAGAPPMMEALYADSGYEKSMKSALLDPAQSI